MSTELFRIVDSAGAYVVFNTDEAVDDGTTKPYYSIQVGQKESTGGEIKQQIRPGLRYVKQYRVILSEAKYIAFMRFVTNGSDDYTITYATAPALLMGDSEATETNDFRVAFSIDDLSSSAGDSTVYIFTMTIRSVRLL